MPRVKIQLADNIKRVVTLDTAATNGATLGTNLFMSSGATGTPALVREWLGLEPVGSSNLRSGYGILISGGSPKTVNVNRAAQFDWQGQHTWDLPLRGPSGTATLPSFTFSADTNTGMYRVGADNLGVSTNGALRWDVDTTRVYQSLPLVVDNNSGVHVRPPAITSLYPNAGIHIESTTTDPEDGAGGDIYLTETTDGSGAINNGFRLRWAGEVDAEGFWYWYRYFDSTTPTEILRLNRKSDQFGFANGSAATPSIGFFNDADTGVFRNAADELGLAVGGSAAFRITTTFTNMTQVLRGPGGSVTAPTFSFFNDADTGIYSSVANTVEIATSTVRRAAFGATRNVSDQPFNFSDGTNLIPSIAFTNDSNTGFYSVGADQLGVVTNGALRLTLSTTAFTATLPWQGPAGSAGTPTFSASGDPNTGMYLPGADVLSFSTAGTLRFQFGAAGQFGIGGATYGTAETPMCSGGASAAPVWGGALTAPSAFRRNAVISPAQLVANTDNWAPTGLATCSVIRFSTDASRNITGLTAQAAGTEVLLCNIGAQDAVLVHDATSTAANRFLCPGSVNFTLNANDSVRIWYDATSARWRLIAY